MMLPPTRRLARYVEPHVAEDRVDRLWAAVEARRPRSWPAWRMPTLTAAFAAVAVMAVLVHARRATPPVTSGIVVESGAAHVLTLPHGSTVTLQPGARVRCDRVAEDRVETTLERGTAMFDVRHLSSRTFVVHAGAFDVVDRGTRFVVTRGADRVQVRVEAGSVAVERPGTSEPARIVAAGESWTSAPPSEAAGGAPPSAAPAGEGVTPAAASAATEQPAPAGSLSRKQPRSSSTPGPHELLEEANDARLSGRPSEAAAAFDALRRRYRSDPRAGLAAFELGRLRLDALSDPAGAIEAFDDALALAPAAPFREDVEARRVEALDRAHDPRCAAAKQAYLKRYPDGLHAAAVAARCSP